MKKSYRSLALILAAFMTITVFSVSAIAEGESSEETSAEAPAETSTDTSSDASEEIPADTSADSSSEDSSDISADESSDISTETSADPSDDSSADTSDDVSGDTSADLDTYTVNIVYEGNGAGSANITFNGTAAKSEFTGAESSLAIEVTPKKGYKITSAVFGSDGLSQTLSETESGFGGSVEGLSAGHTYTLTVVAEIIPQEVALSVESAGVNNCTVSVDGETVDLSSATIMSGSTVTVTFGIDGKFSAKKASLTVNGAEEAMESASYSFVITEDTKIVMLYGVVPVTFTLNGPGAYNIQLTSDSSPVGELKNNNVGTVSKTFYLEKGVGYKFTVTPALNYKLSGIAQISEPDRTLVDDVYFFIPSGTTTVVATMVADAGGSTVTSYTVRINAGSGGTVTAGSQKITGGTGTNVLLNEGDSLELTITPDEGYEIDVLRVGGNAVDLDGETTYTLSDITASTTVSVLFKSINSGDISDAVTAEDIDWNAEQITIDVSGGKIVLREVLDKIATLSSESVKFVEFVSENGTVYIPYGRSAEGTAETANLSVISLTEGELYNAISASVSSKSTTAKYKIYSFNAGVSLPEGTMVTFNLGAEYANNDMYMLLYDSASNGFATKDNAATALSSSANGVSAKYYYDNEGVVIVSNEIPGEYVIEAILKNGGGSINPAGINNVSAGVDCNYTVTANDGFVIKQIFIDGVSVEGISGAKTYIHVFEKVGASHTIEVEFEADNTNVSDSGDENEGSSGGTVIAILVIVLVAILGAAALFIVKWRQEKF